MNETNSERSWSFFKEEREGKEGSINSRTFMIGRTTASQLHIYTELKLNKSQSSKGQLKLNLWQGSDKRYSHHTPCSNL